ncbi:MAG TPA: hypothetical protein VKS60_14470 [Stellaceae bacterium]|nr:hypothetical protein [Stellaceae bacterium]
MNRLTFAAVLALAAAPVPLPGIYDATVWVGEQTGACIDSPGAVYTGRKMTYQGLSGGHFRYWGLEQGIPPTIVKQVFTVTAGKGTAAPSGTFTYVGPFGDIAGTWTAAITPTDAHSFAMKLTESYNWANGTETCSSQDFGIGLLLTGQ